MDDAEGQRHLMRQLLGEHERFEIVADVESAEEALEIIGERSIDLVLLDLSLPRMSGLDAIPRIKEIEDSAVIVVLSGSAAGSEQETCLSRGADGFLEKDLDPFRMVEALIELLDD